MIEQGNTGFTYGGAYYCFRYQLLLDAVGNVIELRKQTLDVFLLLEQHRDCVVSREEIMGTVWKNSAVTNDSLVQCICEIRKALGSNASNILITIPRRGYMLRSDQAGYNYTPKPQEQLGNQ